MADDTTLTTTSATSAAGPIARARASLAALERLERLRQSPGTRPSPEDLTALAGWSGWGPLAPALEARREGSWKQIGERIEWLLTPEDYGQGFQATYNAFYTPPQVAAACWRILTDLGFSGGTVLEPGCGAGVFMAQSPPGISARWIGVERDPTTAAIAGLLHPEAVIHNQELQEALLPAHSVDAVLGNVPFGDTRIYDPSAPEFIRRSLHNYFIWRSVQSLRPGGVAVLLTSRYTLDAVGEGSRVTRVVIGQDADLLGAIRLPNSALAQGGTEPLTDILVLRRRRPGEQRGDESWFDTVRAVGGQYVNAWLAEHPGMVLGEMAEDAVPRYGRTLRVDARADDPPLEVALAEAGRAIVAHARAHDRLWQVDAGAKPITADSSPFPQRADGRKEGSFHLIDGVPHEVLDGQLIKVEKPGKELPKLIGLREAALRLLEAEADHSRGDEDLAPLRAQAAGLYEAYVKAHGALNRYTVVEGKPDPDTSIAQVSRRRPSMGGFRRDPDFVTVLALEEFDDQTRTAAPSALLRRRINRPRRRAEHAETPAAAVALCRDELGHIDVPRIAELLGVDEAAAEEKLGEVAFIDPVSDAWVPADEYLSGNVRIKLVQAGAASVRQPERFGRSVPALEAVQPPDLTPEQITANLGAPWIPTEDVAEFTRELLRYANVSVWNEPRTGTWSVTFPKGAEFSAQATSEWGTDRVHAFALLELGLNGRAPVVYDLAEDGKRIRNQDATMAAADRQDAIAERFTEWVWQDPARADRLAGVYNQRFNTSVPRRFDGAHLSFDGLDPDFAPYSHQRDMVARMISGSDALCPYPVGTGKTATMFMAATTLKRLGLASKPMMIVVPSTLEQIARDGKGLFPGARILMAAKEDLADARARKLFAARAAMEDWDVIVMSHPSFTALPMHPTAQAAYADNLAAEYRQALVLARAGEVEDRKVKQIAKMVDRYQAKAKQMLQHATDDGVFFEHLGVDYLLVDEMHYFKNLDVPVHTDGFAINGSKRAQDLDMKLRWLRQRHPGAAVVTGFTGTPVSNTLLEAFILQRYLQPARLREMGLDCADAWAANFVRFATAVEITPDGGFRLNRRPAEIVNIPELMHTLAEVAELRDPASFPVTRPEVRRHTVAVPASDLVRQYVATLAERAEDIRAGGVKPSEDNILKICSDGRKVALHESLVGLDADGPGKVDVLVENVARLYHQTKDLTLPGDDPDVRGGLQLIFCDLGTPHPEKGEQVYGLIRAGLIHAGVPAPRIRFIHEATSDTRRLTLFDQCNNGQVSVLLGSTDKLGVGVNVQRRAIALHHVDAPWRPDQVEQRDGRVWRPKNLNPAVDIYRYVTEGSFDGFMWQALERKEKALRPILSGQVTARCVEDIGDVALDYGQIKAISTGNPLLLDLNEANADVKRLGALAATHQRNQRRLRDEIDADHQQIDQITATLTALETITTTAAQNPDTTWRGPDGRPIQDADLPGTLAQVAASATTYPSDRLDWRGLRVTFTATKIWREAVHDAHLTADGHQVTVPLREVWLNDGQHWRIRDAITHTLTTAPETATELREQIERHRTYIAEAETALTKPFAHADALAEARARRDRLDAQVRENAKTEEEARKNRALNPPDTAAPHAISGGSAGETPQPANVRTWTDLYKTGAALRDRITTSPGPRPSVQWTTQANRAHLAWNTALVATLRPHTDPLDLLEDYRAALADTRELTDTPSEHPADLHNELLHLLNTAEQHLHLLDPQTPPPSTADEPVPPLPAHDESIPTSPLAQPETTTQPAHDPFADHDEQRRALLRRLHAALTAHRHNLTATADNPTTLDALAEHEQHHPIAPQTDTGTSAPTDATTPDPHNPEPTSAADEQSPIADEQTVTATATSHASPKSADHLDVEALTGEAFADQGEIRRAVEGLIEPLRRLKRFEGDPAVRGIRFTGTVGELTGRPLLEVVAPLRNQGLPREGAPITLGQAIDQAQLVARTAGAWRRQLAAPTGLDPQADALLHDIEQQAAILAARLRATATRHDPAQGLFTVADDELIERDGRTFRSRWSRDGNTATVFERTDGQENDIGSLHLDERGWKLHPNTTNRLSRRARPTRAQALEDLITATRPARQPEPEPASGQTTDEPATASDAPDATEPAPPARPTAEPGASRRPAARRASAPRLSRRRHAQHQPDPDAPALFGPPPQPSSDTLIGPRPAERTPKSSTAARVPADVEDRTPPPENRRASHAALREHALDLAVQGFAVFPLVPGTKKPLLKNWPTLASADPARVAVWWEQHPRANIAIACGPSRLYVLDLDTPKTPGESGHGQHTLDTLAGGRPIPATLTVSTPRGGRHLYFRPPQGIELRNTNGNDPTALGWLIDTRGIGGFVVAPGSVVAGKPYRIEHHAPIAELPTWIIEELAARRTSIALRSVSSPTRMPSAPVPDRRRDAYGTSALTRAAEQVARTPPGGRNQAVYRHAYGLGRLVAGGILTAEQVTTTLTHAAVRAGLPEDEALAAIASGIERSAGRPRGIPHRPDRPPTPAAPGTSSAPPRTTETAMTDSTPTPATDPAPADESARAPEPARAEQTLRVLREAWHLDLATAGLPREMAERLRTALVEVGQHINAHHDTTTAETTVPPDQPPPPAPSTDSDPHERHEPPPDDQPSVRDIATEAPGSAATSPAAGDPAGVLAQPDEFEQAWAGVRDLFDEQRLVLPDLPQIHTTQDVRTAVDQLRQHLRRVNLILADRADAADSARSPDNPRTADPGPTSGPQDALAAIEQHIAAVDDAYQHAEATVGQHADAPELVQVGSIRDAVHTLWETIKTAAGHWWHQIAADARMQGFARTMAARAVAAIGRLAHNLATRLGEGPAPRPAITPAAGASAATLRSAFIATRTHIGSAAATYQWQRIAALWNTINTLSRQATDPGIRAVITRSADTLSDLAENLAATLTARRRQNTPTCHTLYQLALAAEQHAATLRGALSGGQVPVPTSPAPIPAASPAPPAPEGRAASPLDEAVLRQQAARVAGHAHARLDRTLTARETSDRRPRPMRTATPQPPRASAQPAGPRPR